MSLGVIHLRHLFGPLALLVIVEAIPGADAGCDPWVGVLIPIVTHRLVPSVTDRVRAGVAFSVLQSDASRKATMHGATQA